MSEVARNADPALETLLATILSAAAHSIDPRADAQLLVALALGVQAQMLLEQLDATDAVRIVDRAIDALSTGN